MFKSGCVSSLNHVWYRKTKIKKVYDGNLFKRVFTKHYSLSQSVRKQTDNGSIGSARKARNTNRVEGFGAFKNFRTFKKLELTTVLQKEFWIDLLFYYCYL